MFQEVTMKRQMLLSVLCYAIAGLSVHAEETVKPVGLPEDYAANVIYYNNFDAADYAAKAAINKVPNLYVNSTATFTEGNGVGGGSALAKDYNTMLLLGDGIALNKPRTVSLWFNYNDENTKDVLNLLSITEGTAFVGLVSRGGPFGGFSELAGMAQAYNIPGCSNSDKVFDLKFKDNCPPKKWNNIAISSNGTAITWYVNGKMVLQKTLEKPLDDKIMMKRIDFGGPVSFDELVIFDCVLPASGIQSYYDAVKGILDRKNMF